jgi:hypothetical protein
MSQGNSNIEKIRKKPHHDDEFNKRDRKRDKRDKRKGEQVWPS